MRLVMVGGPGAGKGTQAKRLQAALGIPWISTGDVLHQAIEAQTPLGRAVQPVVEKGEFVDDTVMIELMRDRLQQPDATQGWLLDGYPRTAFQAEELDFLLDELGQKVDWAIWLDVPKAILMERSLTRSRDDDHPEAIQRRIDLLYERTIPILDYYGYRQRLLKVDGHQSPEAIEQTICQRLGI
ncbi:adenylate kinase [Oscillatoria sp. CS-180]|uniref:adenylate kinase n=1 Tax=Oscillatoria sp. CS-180 TaxID=3021720 RepID=UPI00232B4ED4|nr:adenylate kinase [Oscillatoria sp. CS-180]MDB9526474.1 adenylate kinase [Oscillatoria sp. CS-180]